MELTHRIAQLFRDDHNIVRLAVVGATSSGKTYLLTDIVGSLYRLGYTQRDQLSDASPHHSVLELATDVTDPQGGVRTTEVYACRSHNHYASDLAGPDRLHIEFLDVPGEVMTPQSIRVFHAVMKSLMACTEKLFTETVWRNKTTRKTIKMADYHGVQRASDRQQSSHQRGPVLRDPRQARRQVILPGATPPPLPGSDDGTEIWAKTYMDQERRRDYYRQKGYEPTDRSQVSGRHLFEHFFDYDTDSVVNTIVDAWPLLDIDERLAGGATGQNVSQKALFNEVYKTHFYFHYYTFYATDVVVCDKCCLPGTARRPQDRGDHFAQMMQSLVALTSYADMSTQKNWYLAFKGADALLREEPFARVYKASGGDIHLTYALFLILFRLSCLKPSSRSTTLHQSLSDRASLRSLLCGDIPVDDDTLDLCADLCETLDAEGCDTLLTTHDEYHVTSDMPLAQHIQLRMNDFAQADPTRLRISGPEGRLLQMPPHVFFTATPIDEQFHIYGHAAESDRLFEGPARHYPHRAYFGTLQLTTCLLREHDLCLPEGKSAEGSVLTYTYEVRY